MKNSTFQNATLSKKRSSHSIVRPSVASGRDLVSLAEQLSTGMWCHAVEVLGMRSTNEKRGEI